MSDKKPEAGAAGPSTSTSSKKNDKKARRAAKVQQKETSGEQSGASQTAAASGAAAKENQAPKSDGQSHAPAEKKQLSKAERRALQVGAYYKTLGLQYIIVS